MGKRESIFTLKVVLLFTLQGMDSSRVFQMWACFVSNCLDSKNS